MICYSSLEELAHGLLESGGSGKRGRCHPQSSCTPAITVTWPGPTDTPFLA